MVFWHVLLYSMIINPYPYTINFGWYSKVRLYPKLWSVVSQVCTYDRVGLGFSRRTLENETTGMEKVWGMSTTGRYCNEISNRREKKAPHGVYIYMYIHRHDALKTRLLTWSSLSIIQEWYLTLASLDKFSIIHSIISILGEFFDLDCFCKAMVKYRRDFWCIFYRINKDWMII